MAARKREDHESHNIYDEFAPMHAYSAARSSFGGAKLGLALKALAAVAALGAVVLFALAVYVVSTLTRIGSTYALIQANVVMTSVTDTNPTVLWRLSRKADDALMQSALLESKQSELSFHDLTPSTTYELTYYTLGKRTSDTKIAGRFAFTTLSEGTAAGDESGEDKQIGEPEIIVIPDPIVKAELRIITGQLARGTEDVAYLQTIGVYYTGQAARSFTASGLPSGLTMTKDGALSGKPALETASETPYTVTISVTDGDVSDQKTFSLYIDAQPEPLEITNTGLRSTKRGYQYRDQITVSRADATGVTYSASGLPGGLYVDAATGAILGVTRSTIETGEYSVTLYATDGKVSAQKTLSLRVSAVATLRDLSLDFFSADLGTYSIYPLGQITRNDEENVVTAITLEGGVPLASALSDAGDVSGDEVLVSAGETRTVTLTVSYTLGGEARQKTATVSASGASVTFPAVPANQVGFTGTLIGDFFAYDNPPTATRGADLHTASCGVTQTGSNVSVTIPGLPDFNAADALDITFDYYTLRLVCSHGVHGGSETVFVGLDSAATTRPGG